MGAVEGSVMKIAEAIQNLKRTFPHGAGSPGADLKRLCDSHLALWYFLTCVPNKVQVKQRRRVCSRVPAFREAPEYGARIRCSRCPRSPWQARCSLPVRGHFYPKQGCLATAFPGYRAMEHNRRAEARAAGERLPAAPCVHSPHVGIYVQCKTSTTSPSPPFYLFHPRKQCKLHR